MKISHNFDRSEFDCHDGTEVPDIYLNNLQELVDGVCQPIRERAGPLAVISGWRSQEWNRRVGGAKKSTHLDAAGVDLRPMSISVAELHALILVMWGAKALPKLGGVGQYQTWIHVDTLKAADGHLRRWRGTGVGSENV